MTERLTSGRPEMGKKFCRKRLRHSNFPLRIAAKLPRKSPEELKLSRQDLLIELIVSENAWRHLVGATAVSFRVPSTCHKLSKKQVFLPAVTIATAENRMIP
ncbi:hypothetical protein NPIL_520661 [Nephila pilipes]|uniref:Uncharacterized protein n=1 Tax=Nephila pilipes TaxID=299642 RepID=A0A8X6NNH0_NEPPI|nr:hypothetical protein NPIL_520661 [Nephila pilipes]